MQSETTRKGASMTTELYTDLDGSIRRRFGTLGDDARVRRTAAALEANGMSVLRAADAAEAKRIVLGLIPDGSQVHHGGSQSLEKSGIAEEIEKSGRYEPLRPRIRSMDRKTQADEIRRLTSAPDVMLGSVHAVTESGSLLAASFSGSQLGPLRHRCGATHLRRGDAEDRVRPRGGSPPHQRVRLPARGCPRPGGVWCAQRR